MQPDFLRERCKFDEFIVEIGESMKTHDQNDTPPSSVHAVRQGAISLEDRLTNIERIVGEIKATIDENNEDVQKELGTGARHFAVLNLRVRALEIVVYGGCGVVLMAVLSAILVTVLRDPPVAVPASTIKTTP